MKHKISRRNLFVIFLMMFVVLFLFMSILVIKDTQNEYDVNDYYAEAERTSESEVTNRLIYGVPGEGDYVVYVGSEDYDTYNTVYYWCRYRHFDLLRISRLSDYQENPANLPKMILIDGKGLDLEDTEGIAYMKAQAAPVVYCNMPNAYVVQKNEVLMDALGILSVEEMRCEVEGVHLFGGFVLGGDRVYTSAGDDEELMDLDTVMVRYRVANNAKTYMVGSYKITPQDTSLQPPLIWRYSTEGGYTFVFNCDLIEDLSGMGYLNACLAECSDYDFYAVVNADVLSLVNFPCLAEEDTGEIIDTYNRSMQGMFKNLIWPSVIAVDEESGFTLTAFLSVQYNYYDPKEPEREHLVYYLMQLNEQKAEAGLSFDIVKRVPIPDKITADAAFLEEAGSEYEYQMMYASTECFDEVVADYRNHDYLQYMKTILTDNIKKDGLFFYADDTLLAVRNTSNVMDFKYSDDLKLRGYENAMLFSNVMLDVADSIYPDEEKHEWQHVEENFAAVVGTFWKNYEYIEKTTLSVADQRIRDFLALKYTTVDTDEGLKVYIDNFNGDGYFVLRAGNKRIKRLDGGELEEIEDNTYLVRAEERELTFVYDEKKNVNIE